MYVFDLHAGVGRGRPSECGLHVLFLFLLCALVGRGRDEGDVGDVDVVLHDVMRKITKAMTIPMMIAMTMPIHCWLLLSRHQYKTLVFLRLSKQKLRNGPQN